MRNTPGRNYPFLLLQYNDRIASLTASKEIGEDYTKWKNMGGIRRMARRRLTRRRLTGRKRGGRILKELVEVDSFHLTTAFSAFSKFLHRWRRRKLVMMVLMMTMMIKMKLMIMRTNIVVNEGDEVVVTGDDDSE